MAKTDVFRIVVVLGDGNHNAICFREPEEGLVYEHGQVVVFDDLGNSSFVANDEGVLPHREPEDFGPEGGGLTWHFAK